MYYIEHVFGDAHTPTYTHTHTHVPNFILEQGRIPKLLPPPPPPLPRTVTLPPPAVSAPIFPTIV